MTLNELIYSVRELLKADSDDSNVSNEFIAFLINSARVDYLKKYLNDFKKITPDSILQTISIDLEACGSQGTSSIKYIRSVDTVPALLSTQSHYNTTTLSGDGEVFKNFNMTSYIRLPYVGSRRGMEELVYGAIGGDSKLYITSKDSKALFLSKVRMRGAFEQPEDVWRASDEYDPDIDFEETEYPLDPMFVKPVLQEVYNIMLLELSIRKDKINDANEDS